MQKSVTSPYTKRNYPKQKQQQQNIYNTIKKNRQLGINSTKE